MTRTIALTGASGFVGRRLVPRLADTGVRVRILVRDPGRLGGLAENNDVVTGDLADRNALDRLVADAEAVVHIAGAIDAPDRAAFDRVNVAGTVNLASAAARAGVRRFVHVSSMAAREPGLSGYGASKLAGENALIDQAGDMSWVIVRPPAVYGPGDKATLPLVAQLTRRHAILPGAAGNRTSLIHVDDLADALIVLSAGSDPDGTIHEVHDGKAQGYSWGELGQLAGELQGLKVSVHHPPRTVLMTVAHAAALVARITGKQPMLTPDKVRELYHPDWVAKHNLLEQHCDWRPRIDFASGVAGTLDWYRRHQWLPAGTGAVSNHTNTDQSETTP